MTNLQSLRQAKHLVRCLLAWFVLSLSAAVASPLLQPHSANWVCTAAGMTQVPGAADEGESATAHQGMHCVLCAPAAAPPPPEVCPQTDSDSLSFVLQPVAAAHVAWRANALLSARGPPRCV